MTIERAGRVLVPDGRTRIMINDRLTVLCRAEISREVRNLFRQKANKGKTS